MFLTGLGRGVQLPVALAVLSVAGVLLGTLPRVRAFLLLGVTSLSLGAFAQAWHAAVGRAQAWAWWASGIVLGAALLGQREQRQECRPKAMPDAHQAQACARPTAACQICAKTPSDRNVTPRNRKARTRSGVPSSTPATESSARAIGSGTPRPRPVRNRSAVEER